MSFQDGPTHQATPSNAKGAADVSTAGDDDKATRVQKLLDLVTLRRLQMRRHEDMKKVEETRRRRLALYGGGGRDDSSSSPPPAAAAAVVSASLPALPPAVVERKPPIPRGKRSPPPPPSASSGSASSPILPGPRRVPSGGGGRGKSGMGNGGSDAAPPTVRAPRRKEEDDDFDVQMAVALSLGLSEQEFLAQQEGLRAIRRQQQHQQHQQEQGHGSSGGGWGGARQTRRQFAQRGDLESLGFAYGFNVETDDAGEIIARLMGLVPSRDGAERGGGVAAGRSGAVADEEIGLDYETLATLEDVPTPLPDAARRLIPRYCLTESDVALRQDNGKAATCTICLCEFEAGDDVSMLPMCAHEFHSECINEWFATKNKCCVCRKGFDEVMESAQR